MLGSRARWFESVPERSNAKDPAPLKVKELWVKERRYIVCLNEEERRKDAHEKGGDRCAFKGATAQRCRNRAPLYDHAPLRDKCVPGFRKTDKTITTRITLALLDRLGHHRA